MTRARQRRLYLLWARPAGSLSVLAASGVLEAVGRGPGTPYDVLIAGEDPGLRARGRMILESSALHDALLRLRELKRLL